MSIPNKKPKTKQEKREEISRKLKIKKQKGGTLAGQIKRTRTAKSYQGDIKRMTKTKPSTKKR